MFSLKASIALMALAAVANAHIVCHPVQHHLKPVYEVDAPAYEVEAPGYEVQEPAYRPYATSNEQAQELPAYEDEDSAYESTVSEEDEPAYEKPAYAYEKHGYANADVEEDEPVYEKVVAEVEQPAYDVTKPAITHNKPAYGQEEKQPVEQTTYNYVSETKPSKTNITEVEPVEQPSAYETKETTTAPTADPTGAVPFGKAYSGHVTYYTESGYGSCGSIVNGNEYLAAISHVIMNSVDNSNPNKNVNCNICLLVKTAEGKQVKVRVVDTCPACDEGSVDLTPTAFAELADHSKGRLTGCSFVRTEC